MMWRLRLILYASIGYMIMQLVPGVLRAEFTERLFRTADHSDERSGRFFFGTSTDVKFGTLAWLLYIDEKNQSGQIFVPPRMLRLSKLKLKENGDIDFQSDVFLGRYYRFEGSLHSAEIEGKIELVNSKSGTVKSAWQLKAWEPSNGGTHAAGEGVIPSVHFSNVDYSEQGGDLVGVDVKIFSTAKAAVGMVVFYESYWGETTFTPFAISHIEKDGATIRFETETQSRATKYHLRMTDDNKGLLYRDDVKEGKGIALKKAKSLFPPLSR